MPPSKLCGSVPAYRSLHRASFRSSPSAPPPAWAPLGGETLFARVSCVRVRARRRASCAGAVRAPDCARGGGRAFAPRRRSREGGGRPGSHDGEEGTARPGRPSPAGRGQGEGPLPPAEAAGEAPATAHHAERAPTRPPPQAGEEKKRSRRGGSWKTPALCHDMSCSSCRRRSFAVPFLHIVPPSHCVPLPSVRTAAGLGIPRRRDPFCARILRARPCAGGRVSAGAVRAPDCARETADALSLSLPAGAFFRPQPLLPSAEKPKGGPGSRLAIPIIHHFLSSQAPGREKYENFSTLPEDGRTEKPLTHLSHRSQAASDHESRFARSGMRG